MLNNTETKSTPNTASLPPPLVLPCDPSSARSEAHPCKDSEYATVIYVTGHRSFWLIPQGVLDKIETSASQLKAAATRETLEQRLEALKKAGLTDLFLPAAAQSFLFPGEQDEWEQLIGDNQADERALKDINDQLEAIKRDHLKSMVTLSPDSAGKHGPRLPLLQNLHADQKSLIKPRIDLLKAIKVREKRLATLHSQGLETAKKAGYEIANGQMFSPEQRTIKRLLSDYFEIRRQLDLDELSSPANADIFVNSFRNNHKLVAQELSKKTQSPRQMIQYLTDLTQLEGRKRDYVCAILDLANIGIATPEYALSNDLHSVDEGVIKFLDFQKLQWQIEDITDDMKNRGREWYHALGGNGPAPAAALLKYQTQIQQLEAQQTELRATAKKNAETLFPPKLFVWKPDDYKTTPEKALIRPGITLREFSLPGGDATLQHFSLVDLESGQQLIGETAGPHTVDDIAISIKVAQRPGDDEILEKLLIDSGARKYPLKKEWFDQYGLFKPDSFYTEIAQEKALNMNDPDALMAWGTYLRSFLFESEAKRHLLSFDDSYTAQFTRLVISGIPGDLGTTLQNELKVEVLTSAEGLASEPSMDWEEGKPKFNYTLAEAEIGANLTYRQGQLDLISIKLPKPEKTSDIALRYIAEDGDGKLVLGRFYCELNLKCWGFVGARMLLSRSVGIEASPGQGIQITGVDREKREVTGATFEAFAGAQAGLIAQAEMHWRIPDRLRQTVQWGMVNEQVPEWMSLGSIEGELTGSAGISAEGEFTIGLKDGRLIFYANAKMTAGLGGGYSLGFELAFDTLPFWIKLLQQELHDNGYRRVYWIDEAAFKYLSMLTNLFLSTALSVSFLAAQAYDFVEEVYRDFNSGRNAGIVAVSITEAIAIANGTKVITDDRPRVSLAEYKSWFLGLQPEAIGPMLHNLVSEPIRYESEDGQEDRSKAEMLTLQQASILQCLEWMSGSELIHPDPYRASKANRIQRHFEESVTRMNSQGMKLEKGSILTAQDNIARLDEFIGRESYGLLGATNLQKYKVLRNRFSLHLWEAL